MQAPSLYRSPEAHTFSGGTRSNEGFTLIEVMVVIAIMAILIALAAPSFRPLIERWRVRDAADSLTSTIYFARAEAIKRGGNVYITRNVNNTSCTNGSVTQWNCGWRVFFDADANGSQDCPTKPTECDLQTVPPTSSVAVNLVNSTGSILIDRWGMASHATGASVPTNMFFEVMPTGKAMTDPSAARLCAGMGGRIVRKKGSETC